MNRFEFMGQHADIQFMNRCLQLARKGAGNVSPNPLVGAVIVHKGRIIGEGYHKKYGAPHAEPNAIAQVHDQELLQSSTLYVSLEPCSHFGKTPPCADLIIKHKIKRVVICNTDPNPKVAGAGIKKLKDAGIEVLSGVLEEEGRLLNRFFFTSQEKKRPFITLKWAQTADGFIDDLNTNPLKISNTKNGQLSHLWRAEQDGILIGVKTFLKEAPNLNTRNVIGSSPLPIILLSTNQSVDFEKWNNKNEFLVISPQKPDNFPKSANWISLDTIENVLKTLCEFGLNSILIEGGMSTHQLFIDSGFWDEACITESQITIGSGVPSAKLSSSILVSEINQDQNCVRFYKNPQQ